MIRIHLSRKLKDMMKRAIWLSGLGVFSAVGTARAMALRRVCLPHRRSSKRLFWEVTGSPDHVGLTDHAKNLDLLGCSREPWQSGAGQCHDLKF